MTEAPKRIRPMLTVTVDPETNRRVRDLVERVPLTTLSSVVDDLLSMSLPVMEQIVEAFEAARGLDGVVDRAEAQRRIEAYIGAAFLKKHNWTGLDAEGGEDRT